METILDILKEKKHFELAEDEYQVRYNAQDAKPNSRGETRLYSLYAVDVIHNYGFTSGYNAWGTLWRETVDLNKIIPY